MKTETHRVYSRVFLNIFAKCHQNRSLEFSAIPFQTKCISADRTLYCRAYDTVLRCVCLSVVRMEYIVAKRCVLEQKLLLTA